MTVIAWDGKTLAADRLAQFGEAKLESGKLYKSKYKDGDISIDFICGLCGEVSLTGLFFDWFENSKDPKKFPDRLYSKEFEWGALVINKAQVGTLTDVKITYYSSGPFPSVIESPYFACGSGRDFAMAAMYLGKTAKEAVEVANALSITCGLGVDTLEFE